MKVEILFSELYIYGDIFNVKYLQKMLPSADFVFTSYQDEITFAKEKVDLIYMGSVPDKLHPTLVEKLRPCVSALKEALAQGTVLFATGNAADLFGESLTQDSTVTPGLGLYPYRSEGTYELRYNSWLMGIYPLSQYEEASEPLSIPIIGNKSEYSILYTDDQAHAFFRLNHGLGLNHEPGFEGYHDGNFFATKLLGPFFIMNPRFSEYFLHEVLKQKKAPLPYKEELMKAFEVRSKKLLENIENNFGETNIQRVE